MHTLVVAKSRSLETLFYRTSSFFVLVANDVGLPKMINEPQTSTINYSQNICAKEKITSFKGKVFLEIIHHTVTAAAVTK